MTGRGGRRHHAETEDAMSKTIEITVDGSAMDCYVAEPAGAGPHPGLVFAHHQDGIDDFTRLWVDRFAGEGFVVIAPNIYHHSPRDASRDEKKAILRDSRIAADLAAAARWLESRPDVRAGDIGILGHCMGGRAVYLGAETYPFKAGAAWYSGGCFVSRGNEGPTPFDRLKDIKCPILGFYGVLDTNPPIEEVDRIEAELRRLGASVEFHRYENTGHSFCNAAHPKRYREGPATESYRRAVAFFGEHLGLRQRAVA
jgi:carboxymethylenebutenolidase